MSSPRATVRVLLPLPLADAYDYALLPNENIGFGDFVEVPLGKRTLIGVVWADGSGGIEPAKLKSIIRKILAPPITPALRKLVDWVADYTLTPPGAVLKMVMGNSKIILPKAHDVLLPHSVDPNHAPPHLSVEQAKAAAKLVGGVGKGFSVTLLDGVTGSGKTEVFCEAVAECLRQGKQALVLLPEIAMTAALMDRFAARFGVRPVEWHSALGEKQRRLNWHGVAGGMARFIVGARSALFLPFQNLGLIVVDEEHEAAFKQEEGVIYHARDIAVVRAQMEKIPIILSSATPSLETLYNVKQGKYAHVVLPRRYGKAAMPAISLIDLRAHDMNAQQFISPPMLDALNKTVQAGRQAMVFLNRRGYAPLTLCRACGHRFQCPQCTSWLIEHKKSNRLHCHHCTFSMALPADCPTCHAVGKFAACGPGVERVAEELQQRLPSAKVEIMASDTLESVGAAEALVGRMLNKEIDVLVGTQIMAKGYHFPNLTFVGVVDADLGLAGGDPRAAERTYQLLQQVAGRSGRADDAGHVMLQTVSPEHPVLTALVKGDRDAFLAAELAEREAYNLPPTCRLAHVTVVGEDQRRVIQFAEKLAASAPQVKDVRILGPAPALFAMLRGRYRHRILVMTPRNINLPLVLREWLKPIKPPRDLRIVVDVDPYSF